MNYMKDMIEQEGFQYLNVHDVVDYDCTTEYLDGGHSNILGAKKCSEALGEYIINRYALPDKRDEDGYESWNDSYKAFCDVYIEVNENRDRYIVYGK